MAIERIVIEVTENGSRVVKRNLEDVGKAAATAQKPLDLFKQTLAALGVGFTMAGVVRELASFEKAIARVRAFSGLAGQDFQALVKQAEQVGETTQFSATEAAQAIGQLARAGESAENVFRKLSSAQNLAAIQGKGLADSAKDLNGLMSAFSLSAADAAEVSDQLAVALKKSDVSGEDLIQTLKLVGPEARAVGVSFEDTVAALTALGAAGIEGRNAVSGLRQILAALQSPSVEARREFEFLGVNVKNLIPSSGGLVNALTKLRKAGVDTNLAFKLFSKDGEVVFDLLTNKGLKSVNDIRQALDNSAGAAAETAKIIKDNLGTELEQLLQVFKDLLLVMGQIAQAFGFTAENLRKVVEAGREVRDVLRAIKGDASSGGFIFGGGGQSETAKGTDKFIQDQIKQIQDLQRQREALRAGPGGAALAPLNAGAGPVPFENVGPQLPAAAGNATQGVEDFAEAVRKGDADLDTFNQRLDQQLKILELHSSQTEIATEVQNQSNILKDKGVDITSAEVQAQLEETAILLDLIQAQQAENAVIEELNGERENAIEKQEILNKLLAEGRITTDDYEHAQSQLAEQLVANDDLLGSIAAQFKKVDLSQKQLGATIGNVLVGAIDKASDALAEFALSGFRNTEALKQAFSDLFRDIAKELIALTIKLLIFAAIKKVLTAFAGGGGEVPAAAYGGEIKAYAAGGFVGSRGEPILVGEKGPELFVPPSSGQIVPNHRLAAEPQVNVAAPKVIIVNNEEQAKTYLNSDEGGRSIVEHIQKNRSQIRQVLG